MKINAIWMGAGLLFLGSLLGYICPSTQSTKEWTIKSIEDFLKSAEVVSVQKNLEAGRTEPWTVRLDDGRVQHDAFFKHVKRTRPEMFPDSYTYELAAYELDKLLNLDRVPPAVEREIDGVAGSLQWLVEECFPYSHFLRKKIEPPEPEEFQEALEEVKVFEHLTYCERKDLDDLLIQEKNWKVCRVDFSEAFSPEAEFIPEHEIVRCSKKLYESLLKLDDDILISRLDPYLNKEELEALAARKVLILKKIGRLIQEKGEDKVLYE